MQRSKERERVIKEAWEKYWTALQQLRQVPHSSERREATLTAGREYVRLVREGGRETVFDEVALMNDINAAAGQQVSATVGQAGPQLSHEERLMRLQKLAAEGHLTKEEYVEARKRLLSEL